MTSPVFDQLIHDHQHYVFRDGSWTTPAGLCVSTSQGQLLTNAFFEQHGRVPSMPIVVTPVAPAPPKPRKPISSSAKARAQKSPTTKSTDRLRAALARRAAALSLR